MARATVSPSDRAPHTGSVSGDAVRPALNPKRRMELRGEAVDAVRYPTRPTSPKRAPESATDVSSEDRWVQTVREVQLVAHRAGYVDVSEQAIRRAYLRGESLLADYRV